MKPRDDGGQCGSLLDSQGAAAPDPDPAVSAMGAGRSPRAADRGSDPRLQSSVGVGLGVPRRGAAAAGDLPRQEGVLHRSRTQGPVAEVVRHGRRSGAGRPQRRSGLGRRLGQRVARGAPRAAAGALSGGDPLTGRSAVPRQDGGCAARSGEPGAGDPGRHGRYRQGAAHRADAALARQGRHHRRPPAGLLALRGSQRRSLRAAVDHGRDHVRADAAVQSGVRRRVRGRRQGADRGGEAATGGDQRAGHRHRDHRARHLTVVLPAAG